MIIINPNPGRIDVNEEEKTYTVYIRTKDLKKDEILGKRKRAMYGDLYVPIAGFDTYEEALNYLHHRQAQGAQGLLRIHYR